MHQSYEWRGIGVKRIKVGLKKVRVGMGWGGAGGEGGGLQCYKVEKRVNYLRGEGVGSKLRWEEMERFGKALK